MKYKFRKHSHFNYVAACTRGGEVAIFHKCLFVPRCSSICNSFDVRMLKCIDSRLKDTITIHYAVIATWCSLDLRM